MHDGDGDSRTIVSARVFAAPRARLFRAFADPDELAEWWGPAGFTNRFAEFDLRPGGAWRYTMHAPDGATIPQERTFVEVIDRDRIVFRNDHPGHEFTMTLRFGDAADGTRMEWLMRFDSEAEAARVREAVVAANEENFDRLGAHLASRE